MWGYAALYHSLGVVTATGESVTESIAPPPEQASAELLPERHGLARGDHWFVWLLALGTVAVPIVVLVCADSIPRDRLVWHQAGVAVQRGDFLVPVMVLCAETVRRWWREVEPGTILKILRILATVACTAAAFVCVVATTTAASGAITPQTGRSITTITAGCLVVVVVFGTMAVAAAGRKAG